MEDFWLDRSIVVPDTLRCVLTPYPDNAMEANDVSSLVNSIVNDSPKLVEHLA